MDIDEITRRIAAASAEELADLSNWKVDLSDIVMNPRPRMTPYGEQDENGVDVSLIRVNLRLTPLERIRQGDEMMRQALRLREYGRLARKR